MDNKKQGQQPEGQHSQQGQYGQKETSDKTQIQHISAAFIVWLYENYRRK